MYSYNLHIYRTILYAFLFLFKILLNFFYSLFQNSKPDIVCLNNFFYILFPTSFFFFFF